MENSNNRSEFYLLNTIQEKGVKKGVWEQTCEENVLKY